QLLQQPLYTCYQYIRILYYRGWIGHIGDERIEGNGKFIDTKSRITLELNMQSNPRTLTYFVNDVQQKNFVVNIPPAVRIWAFLWEKGSSFQISKFESIPFTTTSHEKKPSIPWEYGKRWIKDEKKKNCSIQ
ncbi:MAG: hypothetical protein EZS28_036054, partial [Streblomastix strix]